MLSLLQVLIKTAKQTKNNTISGFRRDLDDICALLGILRSVEW
jgi:hypothetical protein